MIATVTFNPSLDYIVRVPSFRTGILNRTEAEEIYPGGKGINVSTVLSHLGIPTRAYGFLAGPVGEALGKMLQQAGVDGDFIQVPGGMTRINVKLKSGVETEINGRGPRIGEKQVRELYGKLEGLSSSDILVLSGSIPSGMSPASYADIMALLGKKGLRIVVDASGKLLEDCLAYRPFLIKPNRDELAGIFSTEIESRDDVIHYARLLRQRGALNVLVSLGADGAVLVDEKDEVFFSPAPQGKVTNSVGAGDSMVAGFLAGYLKTSSYREALKTGIAAGSASAFAGRLATKEEIENLLSSL